MKLTLEQLKKLGACSEAVTWFKKQHNKSLKALALKAIKDNHPDWANWYLTKLFTKTQVVRYSIYAAEQQLEMYEKQYPQDKRPRHAIEAAKNWLKAHSEQSRAAAKSAAESAWYAAKSAAEFAAEFAAKSAAWSAWSAAESAAEFAAWSALYAAESAAKSAAESAAWKKIILFGLSLIGE